ncbi:TPA: type II secretion system protein, partial [Citrobacter freundii]|nr:type II secretion system protein [Citrobacter freundii]
MKILSIEMAPKMPRNQRGISLIESLVSLLLIAIMGAGLAIVSSRSLVTQRYVTTQNLAVMQAREYLKTAEHGDTLNIYFGKDGGEDYIPVSNSDISSESTVTVSICLKPIPLEKGSPCEDGSLYEIADIDRLK